MSLNPERVAAIKSTNPHVSMAGGMVRGMTAGGSLVLWAGVRVSYHLVRLQVVLVVQSVQDAQLILHGRQIDAQVPVHAAGEARLQLVPLLGH